MPRMPVRAVLMIAYTNDPTRAGMNPPMVTPGTHVARDQEDEDLQDQDADGRQDQRPRGDERQDQWADHGVEHGHDHDDGHRGQDAVDRDVGQQPGGQEERDRRHDQRDRESLDERPRPAPPLPQDPDLRLVEVEGAAHRLTLGTAVGAVRRRWGTRTSLR